MKKLVLFFFFVGGGLGYFLFKHKNESMQSSISTFETPHIIIKQTEGQDLLLVKPTHSPTSHKRENKPTKQSFPNSLNFSHDVAEKQELDKSIIEHKIIVSEESRTFVEMNPIQIIEADKVLLGESLSNIVSEEEYNSDSFDDPKTTLLIQKLTDLMHFEEERLTQAQQQTRDQQSEDFIDLINDPDRLRIMTNNNLDQ